MASRKKLKPFTDPEIRELESAALPNDFLGEAIQRVILSYRVSARVANAAWKLLDSTQKRPDILNRMHEATSVAEALGELKAALHNYSPGNWPLPRGEKEHCTRVLEQLYEEAAVLPTKEAILEKIYEITIREHEDGGQ